MNNLNKGDMRRSQYLMFFSKKKEKKSYNSGQLIGLILGPLLFVLTLLFLQPEGLSSKGIFVLAITLWIATWWIT